MKPGRDGLAFFSEFLKKGVDKYVSRCILAVYKVKQWYTNYTGNIEREARASMKKVGVFYFSGTGNTKITAELICDEFRSMGWEATIYSIEDLPNRGKALSWTAMTSLVSAVR
jgi:flavorubredoxin